MSSKKLSRRSLLKAASALSAASAAAPMGLNLWSSRAEAAAPTDYKALVCVFLYGGSDNSNMVIPFAPAEHAAYYAARGGATGIGIERSKLVPTHIVAGSRDLALNPAFKGLAGLYRNGRAAVVANVGPLLEPTVKNGSGQLVKKGTSTLAQLPPKLRSHNDQQAFWQSFGVEGGASGWGGRIGDLFLTANGTHSIFTSASAFGSAIFCSGETARQYQVVPPEGPVPFIALDDTKPLFGSNGARDYFRTLITGMTTGRMFDNQLNLLRRRSINAEATLSAELAKYPPGTFPQTQLGGQLSLISRMIRAGKALGLKRQVFLVGMGGYDHHDALIGYEPGGQPKDGTQEALLGEVDAAMTAFYNTTASLGIANEVTAFTASDFGRTLTSNGDGSDHGWGSHHFVVGGAVNGGSVFGTMPQVTLTDPFALARGVLLPSTSVDQVAWTLASWFGVPFADRLSIAPNIDNFTAAAGYPRNLGFMNQPVSVISLEA